MDAYDIEAWVQAIVRWTHVFAAILWIGQTYLFNFLERNLEAQQGDKKNVSGSLWMVHGGGFYFLEKQSVPEMMPLKLHWFKWEAAATWISGFILLIMLYYFGGYLIEPTRDFTVAAAVGLGVLVVGWVVYDAMVRSPLGRREVAFAVIALLLLLGVHYGLSQVLTSRAAFFHVGALMGTVMALNVWMRILPSQRKMIAATKAGTPLDPAVMATGPLRSKHNSYMVIPLVFIMISNHYPTISYGSDYSTLILGGLLVAGGAMARLMRGGPKRHG